MGEVWEAEDTVLGRRVALKFVRPESTADRQYQARLIREARALARLRHPGVVAIHDLGHNDDGELFVALELIDGTSARAWQAAAPRTDAEILAVWRTVAEALAAVHRAGIVHRDLKPDNVFIANDGRVVVGDFGLATLAADGGSTTLTASGQIVGTPLYMPLEQLRGATATARSDQFALCVCLWEALAGARPFQATGTLAALVVAMRARPPVPLRRRGVFAVLARGLDPDPDRRWPDIPAMTRALDGAVGSVTPAISGRARRRAAMAAVALAGALAIAALVVRVGDRPTRPTQPPAAAPAPDLAAASALAESPFASWLEAANPFVAWRGARWLAHQVTCREYRRFLDSLPASDAVRLQPVAGRDGCDALRPIAWLTFERAAAFCRAIHAGLPTSEQWLAAAHGAWGLDPTGAGVPGPLQEWTSTVRDALVVVCGGHAQMSRAEQAIAATSPLMKSSEAQAGPDPAPSVVASETIGFRCVR
jgi:protein kinase-like protein